MVLRLGLAWVEEELPLGRSKGIVEAVGSIDEFINVEGVAGVFKLREYALKHAKELWFYHGKI